MTLTTQNTRASLSRLWLMLIGSMVVIILSTSEISAQWNRPSTRTNDSFRSNALTTLRRGNKIDEARSNLFTDFSDNVRITAVVPELQLSDSQTNGRMWRLMSGSSAAGSFDIYDNSAGYRLTINTSGNVGLGTTNPVALLAGHKDLGSDVVNSLATFGYNNSLTNRSIVFEQIGNAGTANQFIFLNGHLGSGSVADTPKFSSNYAPTFGIESNDSNLNLVTSSAGTNVSAIRALSVIPNGNVGIGDTSPASRLTVAGSGGDAAIQLRFSPSYGQTRLYTGYDSVNLAGNYLAFRINQTGGSDSEVMRVLGNGNVGIGATNPQQRLSVNYSGSNALPGISVSETLANGSAGLTVDNTDTSTSGTPSNSAILFNVGHANKGRIKVDNNGLMTINGSGFGNDLTINSSGNVGIGASADPNYKLNVAGNINSTQTITANNIVAKYQDVAEWVPSSEQLSAGTVVVLDSTKSNQVTSSSTSYDTRVAGVVSEQPGIALGEKSEGKVLVATTGRVRVKVDATKGPIHIGDLLVTSDIPGVAMKSEAVNLGGVQIHRPGTLIGKALEPLEKGKGEILVLLSLQ